MIFSAHFVLVWIALSDTVIGFSSFRGIIPTFQRKPISLAVQKNYPYLDVSSYPSVSQIGPTPKQAWIDLYNQAKSRGDIPNIAPSTLVHGVPTYPASVNTGKDGICSWTVDHCLAPEDLHDAPPGIIALGFDDGPQEASPVLYNFLQKEGIRATHFMIGAQIIYQPLVFQQAVTNGEHIACHTWSHPHMTTLTDLQVVGELGWVNQLITDQSGLIPKFFRPPYGDIDNRVRAIAKHVFRMEVVIWNSDTRDWCLTEGGGSSCKGGNGPADDSALDVEMEAFYHASKTPGLMMLEHESTTRSISGFIRNYATLQSLGWITKSIPDLNGADWYLNSTSTAISLAGLTNLTNINLTLTSGLSTSASSTTPATASISTLTPSLLPSSIIPILLPTPSATASASPPISPINSAAARSKMKIASFTFGFVLMQGLFVVLL